MSVFDEPKVDGHCHVLDPARFPYTSDVAYRPAGQEIGTLGQYLQVMQAYGIAHALLVGPNSGYGLDNRCLLDAIERGGDPFSWRGRGAQRRHARRTAAPARGRHRRRGLQRDGARRGTPQRRRHAAQAAGRAGMFFQVQVEHDQLMALRPMLERSGARILIDHCGRPDPLSGIGQAGFQALLVLAHTRRAAVKRSGWQKFSTQPPPHPDAQPFVRALLDAFTLDACFWASDWPFLKAPRRLDLGPLLTQVEQLLPDPAERRRLWWDTPRRWLGFGAGGR